MRRVLEDSFYNKTTGKITDKKQRLSPGVSCCHRRLRENAFQAS